MSKGSRQVGTEPNRARPNRANDAFAVSSRPGTLLLRSFAMVAVLVTASAIATPNASTLRAARGLDSHDLLAMTVPVLLVAIRGQTDRHRRTSWGLLSIALAVGALATASVLQIDSLGTPRPSDIARIAGTIVLIVAVALITRSGTPTSWSSDHIDGMVLVLGAAAAGAMIWADAFTGSRSDAYELRVASLAVAADLLLLAVLASAVSASRYRPSAIVMALILAAGVLMAADVGQLRWAAGATSVGPFDGAQPRWTQDARLIATLLVALAAWLPRSTRGRDHASGQQRSSKLTVIPIVFSLVALGILGAGIVGSASVGASLLAFAAVAAVILRTAMTVHELHSGIESFRLARTDELTSLTNRRGFLEGLDRILDAAPGTVAVMIIDLNGFKEVNDSLGHHAGDELLRLVSERFRPVVGEAGLLARLGGDEFGVVIMVPDDRAALDGAALMQRSLDDPFIVDEISVRVGAAIGVALYPDHSRTRTGVMRSADVAMYDAKQRRTGVEMYHAASDFQTREKLQLLEDLRGAIEHRGLSLYYQPKVHLNDGTITSSESLVRWQHPTRGLLLPDEFVPIAERAGLVPGLTRAVLAQAISFHAERCPHVGVSVNISHRDVVDDNLAEYIADLLQIYHYPAEQLTLEITETELAHDPDRASRSIANLRAAGMRISIDDFGVGYSSMARLLDLAVDEVKIDKSFVLAIDDDRRAIAIIRSTVELADALGLQVVAEGIETPQVLRQIMQAGVDVGQGYLITRPLSGRDYLEFLSSRTKVDLGAAAPRSATPSERRFRPVLPDRPLRPG
jgi:diguanylate cyclase